MRSGGPNRTRPAANSERPDRTRPAARSDKPNRTRLAANVEVGQEIPELVKHPTTRQLVQYAGAQGDFYEIHYDQDYARSVGLPGVILHGLLKAAFLAQLVTDWIGDEATLKTFGVSYRGIDVPAHPYRCRGKVTRIDGKDVELEVWGEDESGKRTTVGTARVELD